jgi:CRP/FNR family cyclic AMP-dependent transcriptional regulator
VAGQVAGRTWPARSFIADLPAALREEFLRLGGPRQFQRGEVIIGEDAHTTEVYVILNGFVRVLNHTYAGDQAMIAIRTRGDLVGELAALDGKPRTSTVVAASTTLVRVIDAPLLRKYSVDHSPVGDAIARSVVAKLRTATRYRVETGQASVLTRVARVLEHLADGYGSAVSAGVLIDVPLPQRDLASLVGASEKGVYRAYDELRRSGVIEVAYRRVTVRDPALLHRYAAGVPAPGPGPATAATGSAPSPVTCRSRCRTPRGAHARRSATRLRPPPRRRSPPCRCGADMPAS